MQLFGSHSKNPQGSPDVFGALQQLAAAGDAKSRATLRAIAEGGITRAGAVPGWNETINWADNKPERVAERAAARALLTGDTAGFGGLAGTASQTHKDWTGGTLAKLAPAAAAFIPGVGLPLAMGIGAGMGAAERATGVTKGNILGGAVEGAGMAAGGEAIGSLAAGSTLPVAGTTTATKVVPRTLASRVGRIPMAVGSYLVKNPEMGAAALATGANIYGAHQMGEAEDRRLELEGQQLANQTLETRVRTAPRKPFDLWREQRQRRLLGGSPILGG